MVQKRVGVPKREEGDAERSEKREISTTKISRSKSTERRKKRETSTTKMRGRRMQWFDQKREERGKHAQDEKVEGCKLSSE